MYVHDIFKTVACPSGTYKDERILGDESTCKKCPDENQSTDLGSTHLSQCSCKKGFRTFNGTGCSGELSITEIKYERKVLNSYFSYLHQRALVK